MQLPTGLYTWYIVSEKTYAKYKNSLILRCGRPIFALSTVHKVSEMIEVHYTFYFEPNFDP